MPRPLDSFAREMADFMPRYMREAFQKFSTMWAKDITISHMITLNVLKMADRCRMNQIAKALHVSTSAATGLVDRMVKADLLKRVPDKNDRRIINIEMTQKGQKIVDDIHKQRYKFILDVFGKIKPAEREAFLGTMKTIYGILKKGKN
jgi:DNA-binding MarR family transcriptional regulator